MAWWESNDGKAKRIQQLLHWCLVLELLNKSHGWPRRDAGQDVKVSFLIFLLNAVIVTIHNLHIRAETGGHSFTNVMVEGGEYFFLILINIFTFSGDPYHWSLTGVIKQQNTKKAHGRILLCIGNVITSLECWGLSWMASINTYTLSHKHIRCTVYTHSHRCCD